MNRSRRELHDALIHVRLTIEQLISTIYWKKLEGTLPLNESQKRIFRNACFESSFVSLRLLNEFFTPEKTKDRITVSYYPGYRTPGPFLAKADIQRLNDHLAHLTGGRLKEPTASLPGYLFVSALVPCRDFLQYLLRDFLKAADAEYTFISQDLDGIEKYLASQGA